MYVSSTLLNQAWKKYKINKDKYGEISEGYNGTESASAGAVAAFDTFFFVLAMIFFILELIVLVYGVIIAINCTEGGAERIVHVVLAIAFTFPYVLVMAVFNNCAKTVLKGGTPDLRSSNNGSSLQSSPELSKEYTKYMFGSSGQCSSCTLDKV